MGTPDYMAPEQGHDSHAVDIRADIYSLGCTLYYLLTGQVPFPGSSREEKVRAHQSQTAAPTDVLRPEVPAELADPAQRAPAGPADRAVAPA